MVKNFENDSFIIKKMLQTHFLNRPSYFLVVRNYIDGKGVEDTARELNYSVDYTRSIYLDIENFIKEKHILIPKRLDIN